MVCLNSVGPEKPGLGLLPGMFGWAESQNHALTLNSEQNRRCPNSPPVSSEVVFGKGSCIRSAS